MASSEWEAYAHSRTPDTARIYGMSRLRQAGGIYTPALLTALSQVVLTLDPFLSLSEMRQTTIWQETVARFEGQQVLLRSHIPQTFTAFFNDYPGSDHKADNLTIADAVVLTQRKIREGFHPSDAHAGYFFSLLLFTDPNITARVLVAMNEEKSAEIHGLARRVAQLEIVSGRLNKRVDSIEDNRPPFDLE